MYTVPIQWYNLFNGKPCFSVSNSDQMWAVSQEGQLYRRFTKYLNKNYASDLDKLLPKRSSVSISSDEGWELL